MRAFTGRSAVLGLGLVMGLALAPGALGAQEDVAQETAAAGAQEAVTAAAQEQPRQIEVRILGMSCPFCAYGAEQKLKKMDGVEELKVDLETGLATLTMEEGADVPNEKLRKVIDDAGFEVAEITRNFESEHPDWKRGEKAAKKP